MFDIAFSELVVIAIVALIVIGPEKLPKVARALGAITGRMQKYMTQIKTRPPSFVIFATRKEKLPESYRRYLVHGLRAAFDLPAVHHDERRFRWALNEDAMATEKLAEGIRAFCVDAIKLEGLMLAAQKA